MNRHVLSISRWPYGLLLMAWFCANTPQVASLHLLLWAKGAGHFSHQEQLTRSVSALLTGKSASQAPRLAATPANPRPPAPALPLDALEKKFVLAAPIGDSARLFAPRAVVPRLTSPPLLPSGPVDDVPHPPPRVAVVA